MISLRLYYSATEQVYCPICGCNWFDRDESQLKVSQYTCEKCGYIVSTINEWEEQKDELSNS